MGKFLDLTGKTFNRLTVISRAKNDKNGHLEWNVECECGNKKLVRGSRLRHNETKSCGCLQGTHHMRYSKVYNVWRGMKRRCYNINDKSFKDYGGRGISVCKGWHKFEKFFEDMGEPPAKTQIDRINNNGNYKKSNCRWASYKENARNKRNTTIITYDNKSQCVPAWSEDTGISQAAIWGRLNNGWSLKQTLTTPVNRKENCKRNYKQITFNDQTLYTSEWSIKTGINVKTINDRFRRGWSIEKTLTTPVDIRYRRKKGKHNE